MKQLVVFKEVRHKVGVSSSPLSQFAENLLITQWHNRQWGSFLMLLVATAPLERQGCKGTQKQRGHLSRSIISYFDKWALTQEFLLPSLMLLWFSQWLPDINDTKFHRTSSRACHSPILLFLTLPRSPSAFYTKGVLPRGAAGAFFRNMTRNPILNSGWDLSEGASFTSFSLVPHLPWHRSYCPAWNSINSQDTVKSTAEHGVFFLDLCLYSDFLNQRQYTNQYGCMSGQII